MLTSLKKVSVMIGLGLTTIGLTVSCRHKPKAESKDYTKIRVADNGHKDSVIDNKPRLYNASIPDPCLKCVIAAVRNTGQLNQYVTSPDSSKITYEVDWASGPKLKDSLKTAGSGLIVHVFRKLPAKKDTLATFTFDNVTGQMYFISDRGGSHQQIIKLDSISRIKIRNSCFWGVASSK
jgi:hypothetical protein